MTQIHENMGNRIRWIDCAKGIAMLLVIFGHSIQGMLRGAIFSFHMPLFFMLSCVTYRCSGDVGQFRKKTVKAFRHLVVPALILFLLTILTEILTGDVRINEAYLVQNLLSLLYASGANFSIGELLIPRLGIPWFLIALFLGRSLFDYLHLKLAGKVFGAACLGLTVVGVALGQICCLPLTLDVALAAIFFMLCGYWLKKWDVQSRAVGKMLCAAVIWTVTLLFTKLTADTYLELAARSYPLFPLCYVTAVAGVLMVSEFSYLLVTYGKKLAIPLLVCGENSMVLLCIHTMDFLVKEIYSGVSENVFVTAVVRVAVNLAVFSAVMYGKRILKRKNGVKV